MLLKSTLSFVLTFYLFASIIATSKDETPTNEAAKEAIAIDQRPSVNWFLFSILITINN